MSINHRGYSSLAPENTLPAYRLSRLKGFRYVETDVRFTADGVPVLLHDTDINRTSDGLGSIDKMTFEEVRYFDFGSWKSPVYKGTRIPSLEEFLALCRDVGLHPILELKTGSKDQVYQIVDLVDEYGLTDVTIYISFSLPLLNSVLEKAESPSIGYLVSDITNDVISNAIAFKSKAHFFILDSSDYKDSSVEMCKAADIPLWVWMINSNESLLGLNPYITAITSDRIHAGLFFYF